MTGIPEAPNNIKYIPQLNMYYDSDRDLYLTIDGKVVFQHPVTIPHAVPTERPDTQVEDQLQNIKFTAATTLKIIAFVGAVVLQYSVIKNKIDESVTSIQKLVDATEMYDRRFKEMEDNINKLQSQINITNEVMNQMQMHLNLDRKK